MDITDKVDPDDVNKTPRVIKAAKEEIGKVDVLVCGECHNVFHFIDKFQEHKEKGKCSGSTVVRENLKSERDPQMWAFVIWKHAHLKQSDNEVPSSSWIIYQQWCKLDPKEKETWIIAAKNIQSFSKISHSKIQEIKTVIPKNKIEKSFNSVTKSLSGDELSEDGEINIPKSTNTPQKPPVQSPINVNKSTSNAVEMQSTENNIEDQNEDKPKPVVNRTDAPTLKPSSNEPVKVVMRKALRTSKDDDIDEAVIDKILGRRFNHKKKCTEYFIKWENLPDSENTWEPKIHLIKCRVLLEEFDRAIDKKKMMAKTVKSVESQLEEMESDFGRPQRTSKQKALNQVKVWCGDMSEGEEPVDKRSFSDDDSSDSFEKKMKFEDDTDSSEEEKPPITIRKISKPQTSLNGIPKKGLDTPTSTAPRVVRVSQKELPNLSSGVYIMSKTEGIIKLDSNNSSPGNSLLKVGTKIGQTHIKMVKKDEQPKSTLGKLTGATEKRFSPIFPKGRVAQQKKLVSTPLSINKLGLKVVETTDKHLDSFIDDESDGVEDLEFPTDLPLPSPDSPPGEFTLCPLTGRVLGESDDIPEVEEPKELEEPKEPEDAKETEDSTSDHTSLDTLVKMAAAELPDVDLDVSIKKVTEIKKDPSTEEEEPKSFSTDASDNDLETLIKVETTQPTSTTSSPSFDTSTNSIATTSTDLEASIKPLAIERKPSVVLNTDNDFTRTQPKTPTNTTVTNVQLLQNSAKQSPHKKLLSTPSTVRQKVTTFQHRQTIQRPVLPKSVPTAIIHKVSPHRNKPMISKGYHESALTTVKRSTPISTYRPANVARRIGNTTIYKTEKTPPIKRTPSSPFSSPQITRRPVKPATVTSIQQPSTPKPAATISSGVINMPLLSTEDEAMAVTASTNDTELTEVPALTAISTENEVSVLPSLNLTDSETPLLITGDDGTIYQVAGQNEEGQTILISEGPDGQQQCVIVSSEVSSDDLPVVMQDTTESEQMEVDQPLVINTQGEPEEEGADSEESHVVAQIIKADPPSPGGTRKVVLMLPDGNLMMTDVTAEQYAALELDK